MNTTNLFLIMTTYTLNDKHNSDMDNIQTEFDEHYSDMDNIQTELDEHNSDINNKLNLMNITMT